MISANLVILIAVGYVVLLFALAYFSERWAEGDRGHFLRSPLVYTLAISVYCTSWTFYGAVGSAARSGLEFFAIYLGPTLVFVGWWFGLRKLVRIGRNQRITSVADLISSRFGKSNRLAVLVTLIAVIGTTPYIALQLKAITTSLSVISSDSIMAGVGDRTDDNRLALGVAAGMALFTILFGTRNVDAKEQHHGVVAAIAFEAIVKLVALMAVGIFVVFGIGGGFSEIFSRAESVGVNVYDNGGFGTRWVTILVLSAAAIICLPRQFQITVVENSDENHLRTASWLFPLYLLGMSVFTLPIAIVGLNLLPAGTDPDMFVLTLPLAHDQELLALFAFIGGFSSATSMIIIASIALSIMVSNHIVMPIALRTPWIADSGDGQGVTNLLLNSRRVSICAVLALGFLYFWLTNGSGALARIGLISFSGVAQFLPSIIAALYWRDATSKGAGVGLFVGFAVWAYTLFLPSFVETGGIVAQWVENGPYGISFLRPEALFGLEGIDPLVHSVFWSLLANAGLLVLVSLSTSQSALERIQSTLFVDAFRRLPGTETRFMRSSAAANDLFFVAQRVLGAERATAIFDDYLKREVGSRAQFEPTPDFIAHLEKELAGSIGAASAHVMLSQVVSGDNISLQEVMQTKGNSETHPGLSPNDEFADYGIAGWEYGNLTMEGEPESAEMRPFMYLRGGLMQGLAQERKLGTNPFKFGMIGGTDVHNSLTAIDEDNFFGKHVVQEPSPHRWEHVSKQGFGKTRYTWHYTAAGYAAVWATDNTREALWDAMSRKEVYATSGSRPTVRFFGGWSFNPNDANTRYVASRGYNKGVPMGADLPAMPEGVSAPGFLVAALKDPQSGNLDRIQ
uniref:DUF3604 domain-containing protein n=1 Tax=uncultured Maritalea sp. TaxID=757249 RepID=UPI002608F00F